MGDNKRRVKKFLLMVGYFPFQILWHICISPIIIVWISAIRSEEQAFEDTYITKDQGQSYAQSKWSGDDQQAQALVDYPILGI